MYLDCTCVDCGSIQKWEELMNGAKKFSYSKLKKLIKKELPELYNELDLKLFNPWENDTFETPTHYILTHSAVEFFIRKN